MDSLTIHYHYGVAMRPWEPHQDKSWRILPYATIVAMDDTPADYRILLQGQEPMAIPPGHAFLIPAGMPFQLELKQPSRLCNAHISFSILDQIDLLSFFSPPGPIGGETARQIVRLCGELALCAEQQVQNPEDLRTLVHMKLLCFSMLDTLLGTMHPLLDVSRKMTELQRIEKVIRHINRHYHQPLTRKALADLIHLSETRFHYVFSDIMGMAPMTYLTLHRLKKAQALLLTTGESITQIAQSTGFESLEHFSRIFKRYYHASPLHYRQHTTLYR